MHAVRLHAAEAAVTVISDSQAVTDWCSRYVRPWWHAENIPAESPITAPVLAAEVDPGRYDDLARGVMDADPREITYARAQMFVSRDEAEGVISAVSPAEGLAYRSETHAGRLAIYGRDTEPVATAAARLAREAVRGVLLRAGWTVLHASAVARDNRVLLTLGSKGAGKTTTALTLAARQGWELLANDRVFVVPDHSGGVRVIPWPSAAALGLGLLDALGWFDVARERVLGGEPLHPTQHQSVTEALLAGRRDPLWDGKRELKAQIFPDQFPAWFDLGMATGGQAVGLLFPLIEPGVTPALRKTDRTLGDADFMSGATEDRYPDVFNLAGGIDGGGRDASRKAVAALLAGLPHHSVTLGHDLTANGEFLTKTIA